MMILRPSLLILALMVSASFALEDKQTYIIHMDKTKMTNLHHYLDNPESWLKAVIEPTNEFYPEEEETSSPHLLYVYKTSMFGFAAQLSSKQLKSLNQLDEVLSVTVDEMLSLHTTHTPEFLGLHYERGLWDAANLVTDVIIGVLDSGIWPEHISFGDFGMSMVPSRWKGACEEGTKFSPSNCNRKLIGARAFFKGYESVAGRINETLDYRSARDSQGHGTHTASTAAGSFVDNASLFGMAKGSARGMRYTSRIAAYKVCWPLGCANTDILAAIDQAVADGADILSLSLGGIARPYYTDSIAIASFGAVQHGVFVSCSAGNSGPSNSTVGNVAPWIMTVAASYIDRTFPAIVKIGNGHMFEGSSLYHGKQTKQLPLVYGNSAGSREAQFCIRGSLNRTLVHGKIVVCERGINTRTEKGQQVKKAGGAGMILINSEAAGEELFAEAYILPATSLGFSAGKAIKSYMLSEKRPTASIYFKGTVYGNPAPVMAAFSSRGPSAIGPDVIKPDVTAPGVNILAAWPLATSPTHLKSDKRCVLFNIVSGTSMSCPHVSGIAALLKSVHKDWSPAAIKSSLMTTAYTLDTTMSPIADIGSESSTSSATPFALGSGHVDPERASDPGLIYDITSEDYLNYLCSLNYNSSQITILSRGNFTCPKDADLQPGDLNYPSFAAVFSKNAQTRRVTYKRTVTNVGNPSCTYSVRVEEPSGVSVIVEPKNLVFAKWGEKLSYNVSFDAYEGINGSSSFGSVIWVSGKYTVRSPIAVTWQ